MEFLNFALIFTAAWLVLNKPEKERLAYRLVLTSVALMVLLFLMAARGSILPGINY